MFSLCSLALCLLDSAPWMASYCCALTLSPVSVPACIRRCGFVFHRVLLMHVLHAAFYTRVSLDVPSPVTCCCYSHLCAAPASFAQLALLSHVLQCSHSLYLRHRNQCCFGPILIAALSVCSGPVDDLPCAPAWRQSQLLLCSDRFEKHCCVAIVFACPLW